MPGRFQKLALKFKRVSHKPENIIPPTDIIGAVFLHNMSN